MTNFLFKDRDGQTPLPLELKNGLKLKNIQTISELDLYEEQNIAEGLVWLESKELDSLDYSFWLNLHRKLFGTIWDWAGKIRIHELQNSDFSLSHNIRTELVKLNADAKYWFEHDTYPKNEIITRIHEKFLTIHPFTNGNGRWSRILTEYICRTRGINKPTWNIKSKKDPQLRRREYIDALEIARHQKLYKKLIRVIFE